MEYLDYIKDENHPEQWENLFCTKKREAEGKCVREEKTQNGKGKTFVTGLFKGKDEWSLQECMDAGLAKAHCETKTYESCLATSGLEHEDCRHFRKEGQAIKKAGFDVVKIFGTLGGLFGVEEEGVSPERLGVDDEESKFLGMPVGLGIFVTLLVLGGAGYLIFTQQKK